MAQVVSGGAGTGWNRAAEPRPHPCTSCMWKAQGTIRISAAQLRWLRHSAKLTLTSEISQPRDGEPQPIRELSKGKPKFRTLFSPGSLAVKEVITARRNCQTPPWPFHNPPEAQLEMSPLLTSYAGAQHHQVWRLPPPPRLSCLLTERSPGRACLSTFSTGCHHVPREAGAP